VERKSNNEEMKNKNKNKKEKKNAFEALSYYYNSMAVVRHLYSFIFVH
jgi:hypothetical protein